MAVIYRISTIFEMEEYDFKRELEVAKKDVEVSFDHVDVGWGFKIS